MVYVKITKAQALDEWLHTIFKKITQGENEYLLHTRYSTHFTAICRIIIHRKKTFPWPHCLLLRVHSGVVGYIALRVFCSGPKTKKAPDPMAGGLKKRLSSFYENI